MSSARSLSSEDILQIAIEQSLAKKADDLLILNLSEISFFTDYFLIMTVQSERQAQAVCDAIVETLKKSKIRPHHEEGYSSGQWILLDYIDIVVHLFQPESRSYYGLEKLWGDAPDVTGEFLS